MARAPTLGYRPLQAEALLRRGLLETATDAFAAAETSLQAGLSAAIAGRDDRLAARVAIALAAVLGNFAQRHGEAWAWIRFATATIERLGGGNAALEAHSLIVLASLQRAQAMREPRSRAGEDSLSTLRRALSLTEAAHGPGHPDVAVVHHNLGGELLNLGRYDEAEQHHRASLRITSRAYGDEHPAVGWTLTMLGDVLRRAGRVEAALTEYRRALNLLERAHAGANHRTGVTLNNIGDLLRESGRHAEAIPYLERARTLHQKVYGAEHFEVAVASSNLAEVYLALRRDERAKAEAEHAARIFRATLGAKHVYLGYPWTTLGRVALRRGDTHVALTALEAALAVRRGQEHDRYELGVTRFALARALWRLRTDRTRALRLARTAREDFVKAGSRGQAMVRAVGTWLR